MRIPREPTSLNLILNHGISLSREARNHGHSFSMGRMGLKWIAKVLVRRGFKEVWLPAWTCDVVPLALASEGLRLHYYPVNAYGEPERQLSQETIDPSCTALLWIDYFSSRVHHEANLDWARQKFGASIEDNAHGALSPRRIQQNADFELICTGKVSGSRRGAIVLSRSTPSDTVEKTSAKIRKELVALWHALGFSRLNAPPFTVEAEALREELISKLSLDAFNQITSSRVALWIWAILPRARVAKIHKANALAVSGAAIELGLSTLRFGDLDVPWTFPIRYANSAERDRAVQVLRQNGIEAFAWPALPSEIKPGHLAWQDHYACWLALPLWHPLSRSHWTQLLKQTVER